MSTKLARAALTASALAALLTLAACGGRVENTEMPQPERPNVEINRQGMEGSQEENAGVGVVNGQEMARATADTDADPDARIAEEVKAAFASNPEFGATKIDVHSEDGKVTLRGRAPDPQARERASDIARTVREVKSVDNQLTLG